MLFSFRIVSLCLVSITFFLSVNMVNASVIDAVVNIEFNKARAWDDGYNSSGVGTGFVIDAEQGFILTNRHILNVAPVVAYAEFSNKKLLPLTPVYRDPIHDFGIFRYDVTELDGLSVEAIELQANATVGETIRLYGNDGGEALSIIEGVLSRVDRPAPDYASTNTDVNTYYYQAALGSSGGSSGSPILNERNQAIAINAGGRRDTAASFFLPMKMILPTIDKVMKGLPVERGTLQVVFSYEPYNTLRKIGWDDKRIELAKEISPNSLGKLVVEHIVPESPAEEVLEVGDVLIALNGNNVDDFYQLAELLNANVGDSLVVEVERHNKAVKLELSVSDLFGLIPNNFVEYGSSIIIDVGINLARLYNIPVKGVVIVDPGLLFGSQNIRRLAVINEINDDAIHTLDELVSTLETFSVGEKFSVRYRYPYDHANQMYKLVTDYTHWFSNQRCFSELEQRLWRCVPIAKIASDKIDKPSEVVSQVTSPIVHVEVFRPLAVNMNNDVIRRGNGAIVDKKEGLIITDKTLIDSTLSEVSVTLNNGLSRKAEVLAIHPYLNLVLIRASLDGVKFKRGSLPRLENVSSEEAEQLTFISNSSFKDYKASGDLGWPMVSAGKPAFDTYAFSVQPDTFGIYVDKHRRLIAVNPAYSNNPDNDSGIPIELVYRFVSLVKQGDEHVFELEDTFQYISFSQAIELGLSNQSEVRRFVAVKSAAQIANSGLRSGDVILSMNQESISSLNNLYNAIQFADTKVSVLRGGKVSNITIKSKQRDFVELNQVLFWAGSVIHEVPAYIRTPTGYADTCLRVGVRYFGAPLHSSGAGGAFCIYSVDGKKVEALQDIKDIVFEKQFGDYTLIRIIDLEKNFQVSEHKLTEEPYYWKTLFYQADDQDPKGWKIEQAMDY